METVQDQQWQRSMKQESRDFSRGRFKAGLFRVLCVLPADYRPISKLIRVWNVERVTASSCDIGEAPLSAAQMSM